MENRKLSPNVILADADYIDKVAFDLSVNFERMLGRRIPPADMARWVDCIALDGGIREGDNEVQVILVHERTTSALENFRPSSIKGDLDGKAFKDHLGEFCISAIAVEDSMVDKEHLFCDSLMHVCSQPEVRRVMVIPNGETYYDGVRRALKDADDEKRITVFAMQPMPGGNFWQEILGYSLMNALGIRGEEVSRCAN
ncbi:MAG: DUF6621 family protein [Prevotella sp.]